MPSGKHKSRSMRRVFVRTPGSKNVLHYKPRKPKQASCASCGSKLAGVPRKSLMKNIPKTAKRPTRPYGGVLCTKCTRKKIKEDARK
ncbi:MAG: 50S ribosomal protein L34e [bacterium]|nr:50S ribosomal protein L34e [bacterium]